MNIKELQNLLKVFDVTQLETAINLKKKLVEIEDLKLRQKALDEEITSELRKLGRNKLRNKARKKITPRLEKSFIPKITKAERPYRYEKSFSAYVKEIFTAIKNKPLSVKELYEKLIEAGFKTTSKNPMLMVRTNLRQLEIVKKLRNKKYKLK